MPIIEEKMIVNNQEVTVVLDVDEDFDLEFNRGFIMGIIEKLMMARQEFANEDEELVIKIEMNAYNGKMDAADSKRDAADNRFTASIVSGVVSIGAGVAGGVSTSARSTAVTTGMNGVGEITGGIFTKKAGYDDAQAEVHSANASAEDKNAERVQKRADAGNDSVKKADGWLEESEEQGHGTDTALVGST